MVSALRKNLARGLFCLIILFGFINSSEGYNCYKCEAIRKTDSCAVDATNQSTVACGSVGTKCTIVRETDASGNVVKLSRGCHLEVAWLGAKSKCSTKDSHTTCQVTCSKDLCNDLTEDKVEACAKSDCMGAAPIPGNIAIPGDIVTLNKSSLKGINLTLADAILSMTFKLSP